MSSKRQKEEKASHDIICLKCNEPQLIRNKCPMLTKKSMDQERKVRWLPGKTQNLDQTLAQTNTLSFVLWQPRRRYYLNLTPILRLCQTHHSHRLIEMRIMIYLLKISTPVVTPSLKNILS